MKVFWNPDYVCAKHAFDTTRKSENIVHILDIEQSVNIDIVDPNDVVDISVVENLIENNLSGKYLRALKTGTPVSLSSSQGFPWDQNIYPMARAHTHGLIASVNEVISSGGRAMSLSSGLHHASPSYGMGFCTINGIALSAIYASELGCNVLILDFDAHCGGGTMQHIHDSANITQIDVSTNSFDKYHGFVDDGGILSNFDEAYAEYGDGRNFLTVCRYGNEYIGCIERALQLAEDTVDDDTLIIYNAGIDIMDLHSIDEHVVAMREKLVSEWIGDKSAICALAGGYSIDGRNRDSIAQTHILNINEWAGYEN